MIRKPPHAAGAVPLAVACAGAVVPLGVAAVGVAAVGSPTWSRALLVVAAAALAGSVAGRWPWTGTAAAAATVALATCTAAASPDPQALRRTYTCRAADPVGPPSCRRSAKVGPDDQRHRSPWWVRWLGTSRVRRSILSGEFSSC